jgi:thioredoxin-like negative regulator of GroEL
VAGAKDSFGQAEAAAAQIKGAEPKATAYLRITLAHAETGDVAGAKAIVAQIADGLNKADAYTVIAKAQVKAGDAAGAKDSFGQAKAAAAQIKDVSLRVVAYADIVETQAKARDVAGAIAEVRKDVGIPLIRAFIFTTAASELLNLGRVDLLVTW